MFIISCFLSLFFTFYDGVYFLSMNTGFCACVCVPSTCWSKFFGMTHEGNFVYFLLFLLINSHCRECVPGISVSRNRIKVTSLMTNGERQTKICSHIYERSICRKTTQLVDIHLKNWYARKVEQWWKHLAKMIALNVAFIYHKHHL